MIWEQILKDVFPLLECTELAKCMSVCKQWRDAARDDCLWKCLCSKRWPSFCKGQSPTTLTYYKLFQTFYKRQCDMTVPPPKLTFNDLEFYVDIWVEEKLIFSDVVPGPVLAKEAWIPPPGACDKLRVQLADPGFKLILPFEPSLTIPLFQCVRVSMFVGRKDTGKVSCLFTEPWFHYEDPTSSRSSTFTSLCLGKPESRLVLRGLDTSVSLLSMSHSIEEAVDVFGIQMRFCFNGGNSEDKVLLMLDMLDWEKFL